MNFIESEASLIKLALEMREDKLYKRGLLPKKILPLDGVDFKQVVSFTYNRYFKTFEDRTISISSDDYSKIIEELFLDSKPIALRGSISLGKKFEYRHIDKKHKIINKSTNKEVEIDKLDSIILKYVEGKNLQNYLITIIKNKITTFKNVFIERTQNTYYLDSEGVKESLGLLVESDSVSENYDKVLEDLYEEFLILFEEVYEIRLPKKYIVTTLELLVNYEFSKKDMATILGCKEKTINNIFDTIVKAIVKVFNKDELLSKSLSSHLINLSKRRDKSKEVKLSSILENLTDDMINSISTIRNHIGKIESCLN